MTWNLFMIAAYMGFHFMLFSRALSQASFNRLGIEFAILLVVEIAIAIVNTIMVSRSVCNDGAFAVAANFSSIVIVVINSFTLITSIIFFLVKTHIPSVSVKPSTEVAYTSA